MRFYSKYEMVRPIVWNYKSVVETLNAYARLEKVIHHFLLIRRQKKYLREMSKCRLTCWTIFYHREIIVKEATGQIQEDLEVSEAQLEGIGFILWKLDRTIQFTITSWLYHWTMISCLNHLWFDNIYKSIKIIKLNKI